MLKLGEINEREFTRQNHKETKVGVWDSTSTILVNTMQDKMINLHKCMTLLVGMLLTAFCFGQGNRVSISFLDIILHPISVPSYDFTSDLSPDNQIIIENSLLEAYIHQHIEKAELYRDCAESEFVLGTGMIRVIYFDGTCTYHTLYIDRIYTKTLQLGETMIFDGQAIKYDIELAKTISSIVNYMESVNTRCVDSVNTAINHILQGGNYEYFPLLPTLLPTSVTNN